MAKQNIITASTTNSGLVALAASMTSLDVENHIPGLIWISGDSLGDRKVNGEWPECSLGLAAAAFENVHPGVSEGFLGFDPRNPELKEIVFGSSSSMATIVAKRERSDRWVLRFEGVDERRPESCYLERMLEVAEVGTAEVLDLPHPERIIQMAQQSLADPTTLSLRLKELGFKVRLRAA